MQGLKKEEIERIRNELQACKRPIFFFHDDADGLCSFLLLYRWVSEGRGICVKSRPSVNEMYAKKAIEYEADKIFVLDLAIVKQEFLDMVKAPVFWIDHHQPLQLDNVTYFNPRKHKSDAIYPATNICHDVVEQDLWIAMVGCVGDWTLPSFTQEFCKEYPDLLHSDVKSPPEAMFDSKLGELVKMFNFVLKGTTTEVNKCVKILTRVKSPYELLNQETAQGKFIYKRYEMINKTYERVLEEAKKCYKKDDKFLLFEYMDNQMSFTGEISNELLYRYPDKIIIIAREKSGEMRMSLRSSKVVLPPVINKVMAGLNGYGGGHEHACGACVKKEQFGQFIENLRKEIGD